METGRFVQDVVAIVQRAEASNLQVYTAYADITERFGLRRLLLSVSQQVRDHLDEWQSLVSTHCADELFHVDRSALDELRELEIPRAFDSDMEYHDFLLMLHDREESIAAMYALLRTTATAPESTSLCARHETDSVRSMAMARDRYDLEVITRG